MNLLKARRLCVALITGAAIAAAFVISPVSLVETSTAQAGFYWGCEWNYQMCTGRQEKIVRTTVMNEYYAWYLESQQGRYPSQYHNPGKQNPSLEICAGAEEPQGHMIMGVAGEWACGHYVIENEYPSQTAYGAIGGGLAYHVSLYERQYS